MFVTDGADMTWSRGGEAEVSTLPALLAPVLVCSSTCAAWLIASAPARLAHLESKVRSAHSRGRSIVMTVSFAGAAVGARTSFSQAAFLSAHGAAAILGGLLYNGVPLIMLPFGLVSSLSLAAMALAPLACGFAFVTGSIGLAAGAVSGAQLARRMASPRVGLEAALWSLRGRSALDASLLVLRAPLAQFVYWSPLLTLASVALGAHSWLSSALPPTQHFRSQYFPGDGSPDFTSRRSKFSES